MKEEGWYLSIGAILVISGMVIVGASLQYGTWNLIGALMSYLGFLIGMLVGYLGFIIGTLGGKKYRKYTKKE